MHPHCGGVVVGIRRGHMLRHHGTHPVDESLRGILSLYATNRHRSSGCFRSARRCRSRTNVGEIRTNRGWIKTPAANVYRLSYGVVVCVRQLNTWPRWRRPGQRDFLERYKKDIWIKRDNFRNSYEVWTSWFDELLRVVDSIGGRFIEPIWVPFRGGGDLRSTEQEKRRFLGKMWRPQLKLVTAPELMERKSVSKSTDFPTTLFFWARMALAKKLLYSWGGNSSLDFWAFSRLFSPSSVSLKSWSSSFTTPSSPITEDGDEHLILLGWLWKRLFLL